MLLTGKILIRKRKIITNFILSSFAVTVPHRRENVTAWGDSHFGESLCSDGLDAGFIYDTYFNYRSFFRFNTTLKKFLTLPQVADKV